MTTTTYTLPCGRVWKITEDGQTVSVSLPAKRLDAEDKASLERLTAALLGKKSVQSNMNILKFPRYRGQCVGYQEAVV
jgi:hypothetical protein